jgi:hypothetical protein
MELFFLPANFKSLLERIHVGVVREFCNVSRQVQQVAEKDVRHIVSVSLHQKGGVGQRSDQ